MSAALWPLAVVIVAVLAWHAVLAQIRTRRDVTEARIAGVEAKLEALKDTGKVLSAHNARLAAMERTLKSALVGDDT
jgi:hypothetical protein